ncbi:hypothetical protein Ctob_015218 [Chrysochromulina tobinii]|uniref:Uncharacterized protein n=1 Tax=Chrysochromulina tobinii TaxID=1460289 RepID=A0A0M0L5R8_9EUKA|nr:hypothetical protein Ctob_015218 [Chrysochromulina tobinii]|eukprot:KOO45988.1 hypothetical protein Ctob_015218 [Chrysochromulina sp. CCMP291]
MSTARGSTVATAGATDGRWCRGSST